MKKNTKRIAVGTVVAAAAGYVAGILTAPKSGKETRKDIKDTTVKGITIAEKELKQLHTELNDLLRKTKDQTDKLSGRAKEEFDSAVEASKQAKEKARVILSAIHEGDADDKDLKKAIGEAKKATEHLKSYLTK